MNFENSKIDKSIISIILQYLDESSLLLLALQFGLGRALHGHGETTVTCEDID